MDLAALGVVVGALGGVVKLVLDANARQTERFTKALDEQAERQERFLNNHMSKNTAALERVTSTLAALVEEVRGARI